MKHCTKSITLLPAIALPLFLACGGGGGGGGSALPFLPPAQNASSISYIDPATGSYRLVKSTSIASTDTHLVFDLVGPAGVDLNGVGFEVQTDPAKVAWVPVDPGDPELARNPSFSGNPAETLFNTHVSSGVLQVGIFQKSTVTPVTTAADTVLAQIALDMSGSSIPANSSITFAPVTGKTIILNVPTASTPTTAISISVGSLSAK